MSLNHTLRRESTDERKLAIAQAARELIIEKGFEGLRTRDIAERVGINIATLHYHVPSKDALVQLVAESIRDDFRDQSARRPRAHLPALTKLRMELEDFREILLDMPQLLSLMAELSQRARRDEAVSLIMRPLHDFWTNQFVEIFEAGRQEGAFRPDIDPTAAAHIVTGALSDSWRNQTTADPAMFDRTAAEIERAFLNPVSLKD